MGEEAFDEVVLSADTGTITVRGGYGREYVWIGIHEDNDPEGQPTIGMELTPRQQKELVEAIGRMTIVSLQDVQKRIDDCYDALTSFQSNLTDFIDAGFDEAFNNLGR